MRDYDKEIYNSVRSLDPTSHIVTSPLSRHQVLHKRELPTYPTSFWLLSEVGTVKGAREGWAVASRALMLRPSGFNRLGGIRRRQVQLCFFAKDN